MLLIELKYPSRPVERDPEYGMTIGRYIGVRFTPETKKKIAEIVKSEKIPNPLPPKEYHATVVYSRLSPVKNFKVKGNFKNPVEGVITGFKIFESEGGKRCLVATIDCEYLKSRHKLARKLGASHDYDQYIPHITLSYDVGDSLTASDLEKLTKKYKGTKIQLASEYEEPLDPNKYN